MVRPDDLPDFNDPPVTEVALSIQFERIEGFRLVHCGLLWERFRTRFPRTEEHPSLDPMFETFGGWQSPVRQLRFEFSTAPDLPRLWFLDETGTEIIQFQPDRLIRNWRKLSGRGCYPRYESIRHNLLEDIGMFSAFLEEEKLGGLVPNQTEITYVNEIALEKGDEDQTDRLFRVWKNPKPGTLGSPEDVAFQVRFILRAPDSGEPLGRLAVAAAPVLNAQGVPVIRLSLTARGAPLQPTLDGAVAFLDIGREHIVRAFTVLTTDEMHTAWGREV